jgi:hypothetical protein
MTLFSPLPQTRAAESVDLLLARSGPRIERIVSYGQTNPPFFRYGGDAAARRRARDRRRRGLPTLGDQTQPATARPAKGGRGTSGGSRGPRMRST